MRKKIVIVCFILLLAIQSYTFGEIVVPGYTVQTYANVSYPGQMAFDSEGVLYVGNYDNSTQNGYIRRIELGGTPVRDYGDHGFYDADAVAVDADGSISGTKGTVLVGCGYPGRLYGIKPDQSVITLFTDMASYNPTQMIFDSTGRLLIIDPTNAAVYQTSGDDPAMLFSTPTDSYSIAVDTDNRIFISDNIGSIRVYENGLLSEFATLSSNGPTNYKLSMAFGTGNDLWEAGLYVLNDGTGNLSRFDLEGHQTIIGTGYDPYRVGPGGTADMTFGPDGALYISTEYNEILRIVLEPEPIQTILGFIEKSVADGTLVPVKEGKAGQGQLGALINMIEAAGNLIDANDPNSLLEACGQLHAALGKTDGQEPPPDFVTGPAAPQLEAMLEEFMGSLGCE